MVLMTKITHQMFWMSIGSLINVASVLVLCSVVGCSGGGGPERTVAPVKGVITFRGEPVKGGSITLRPIEVSGAGSGILGKPASGVVQDDGSFVLSTYGKGDGAVVGKHQVMFTPIMIGPETPEDKPKPSPYLGLQPDPREVDVQPGTNELMIELTK